MINFILGLLSGILLQWFILHLRRAKLKLRPVPTYEWFVEDMYYPYLHLYITNNGHTKTEVSCILLEFKQGSSIVQEEIPYYKSIIAIEAKSTETLKFNDLNAIIMKRIFHENKLYRGKVVTTDDKVFRSKWQDTKDALTTWKIN